MYDVNNKKIQNITTKDGRAGNTLSIKQVKQIDKLFKYITKMKNQIQRIQSDTNMTTVDKQRKIARCQEIVNDYETEIRQTLERIQTKNPSLYATLMNRLEKQK